jgi:hypothetical protein
MNEEQKQLSEVELDAVVGGAGIVAGVSKSSSLKRS